MTDPTIDHFVALLRKHWHWLALILILLVALWYRLGIIDSYVIPTYGNTMYHVGIERETVLTGFYPTMELSYGGGFPNFYVPAYRLLIASMSVATGIDPMVMSGLMTIVIALFILMAIYILALRLSHNKYVALFAAFFFIMSPEITIFTMRSLPELLGLFLTPLTIYFILKEEWGLAVIGAIVTALTHQMTLAALVGIIGLYAVLQLIWAAWLYNRSRTDKQVSYMEKLKYAIWCFVPAFAACATYGLWQVYSLGTLSLFGLAQVVNREGNVVDLPLFARTGIFVLIFFAIGLASILYDWWAARKPSQQPQKTGYELPVDTNAVLLILSWLVVTIVLMKNDLLGIHIFMDRFFTFFVMIAIVVAGYGMYAVLSALDLDVLKEKQE